MEQPEKKEEVVNKSPPRKRKESLPKARSASAASVKVRGHMTNHVMMHLFEIGFSMCQGVCGVCVCVFLYVYVRFLIGIFHFFVD